MHKMLLEIPARIEAERIYLRSYEAGDGQWYYAMRLAVTFALDTKHTSH